VEGGLETVQGRRLGGEGREAGVATDQAYCVKCRTKRDFDGEIVTMKNGRPAAKGKCPVCGTGIQRILSQDDAKARGWTG